MKKGILKTLIFYGIGFGLAGLVYLIIGHPYLHAPGFHHLILVLTLIGGLLWTVRILFTFLSKERTNENKGILITSSLILISSFLYVAVPILSESDKEYDGVAESLKTEIKGDTTYIYHNGNPVYIQVKDSVLLDFMKNGTD